MRRIGKSFRRISTLVRRFYCFLLAFSLVPTFFVFSPTRAQNSETQTKRYKPELVVQSGHKGKILTMAFSPDGKMFASAGEDLGIKLWDVETGKELRTLYGHKSYIRSIVFSADGKRIVSGGDDFTVRVWNVMTGEQLLPEMYHSNFVYAVALSPDGKKIISGGNDEVLTIWDAETGKFVAHIGQPKDFSLTADGLIQYNPAAVNSVAFSPTNDVFAWAAADSTIGLVTTKGGAKVQLLTGHTAPVHSLLFMPDGATLISASANEVKFWDVQTGKETSGPEIPKNILSMSISHDGKSLAFVDGSSDLKFVIGDGKGGPKIFKAQTAGELKSVLFSPDNDKLATVAFVPDRETVATGGKAGVHGNYVIKLWRKSTAAEVKVFEGEANVMYAMSLSPDGRKLAISDIYSTIRIWNPDNVQPLRATVVERAGRPSIDFSPDSMSVAVGSWGGTRIINAETGEISKQFDDIKPTVFGYRLAFTPDSKLMLVAGDTDLSLWDSKTGALIRTFGNRTTPDWKAQPSAVAIDPAGKLVAGAGIDGVTTLWDLKTGKEIRSFCKQTGGIGSIAFDATGKFIVSAAQTGTVKVCDVTTGNEIQDFKNTTTHLLNVGYAIFTPDSKYVAGVDIIGGIRLWNVATGAQVKVFPAGGSRAIYSQNSLAFSPDGKTLFCANGATNMELWNVETGAKIATLITVGDNDWAVVTPDGLFDASDGAQALMHFVVSDPQFGYETISLNQLKSRYWVPGLLKKIFDREPLPSAGEFAVTLFPEVQIEQSKPDSPSLKVDLRNRGGGIGRVEVRINGSELTPDARVGQAVDPHAADVPLNIDIPKERLRPGDNKVETIVWNLEGDVQSRSHEFFLNLNDNGLISKGATLTGNKASKSPSQIDYYAIVSGISNYSGDSLNLRYAAKDAEDMARALTLAARKYFCADEMAAKQSCTRVHVRLLSTETNKDAQFAGLSDVPDFQRLDPVKANYQKVFKDIANNARADDVVTVYFSGHATSITTDEAVRESAIADTYLYATRDATTLDRAVLANETERDTKTVSSLELAKWLSDIKAEKKVLVLDTCAAGAVQKDLVAQVRDVDPLQAKSIDRLRDRTGFYVLMGSAANAQSFEANEYRQGLLTYSLLEGMTIDGKLRDGRFLDVEKWFGGAADRVEDLAKGIGGVQRPSYFKSYSAASFDIGRIEAEERNGIPLASRVPLILEPLLFEKTNSGDLIDTEGLSEKLETRLLEQSLVYARGNEAPINYIKASKAANGISPRGFYTITGDRVTVEVSLVRDKSVLAKVKVVGTRGDVIEKLIVEILRAIPTGAGQ